jgi:hypothetical protein
MTNFVQKLKPIIHYPILMQDRHSDMPRKRLVQILDEFKSRLGELKN